MSSPQSGGLPKNELESDPVEMTLIHLLIEFPDKISQVLEEGIFEFVLNQDLKRLGLELKDRYHDKLVITDLIEVIGSQWLRENILKLTVSDNPFGKDVSDKVLSDTIVKIKKKWFKARHKELSAELREAQEKEDLALCRRLVSDKEHLRREEKKMACRNK